MKESYFLFKYHGDYVPETLNISLSLTSSSVLRHLVRPSIIYFYFTVTKEFQTLPNVMKLNLLHQYRNNSNDASRKIYNIKNAILYDHLQP